MECELNMTDTIEEAFLLPIFVVDKAQDGESIHRVVLDWCARKSKLAQCTHISQGLGLLAFRITN